MRLVDILRFSAVALSGHRVRTLLSLLGVAIGVMAVLVLTSLGEGARLYVVSEFTSLGSNLLIVLPGRTETTGGAPVAGATAHDLTPADGEAIRRHVRGVRRLAPLAFGTASVRFGDRTRDVPIIGTTDEMESVRRLQMGIGQYLPRVGGEIEARVCVVGAKVQTELFGGLNPLGENLRIGQERFRVIGVLAPRGLSMGMDFDEAVHVPVRRALRLFNRTSLFRILIEAGSHDELPALRGRVAGFLKQRHAGEEDVTVLTQDAVVETFGRILSILTAVVAGIAAISLTVAGIGIMNVMLVSVSERTREIGLLKALGVTSRQVVAVFLAEASLLSSIGGIVGLTAGLFSVRLLRAVYPAFPAEPPSWAVAAAAAVSIAVGMIFGALPARRAARLDPVAALARR